MSSGCIISLWCPLVVYIEHIYATEWFHNERRLWIFSTESSKQARKFHNWRTIDIPLQSCCLLHSTSKKWPIKGATKMSVWRRKTLSACFGRRRSPYLLDGKKSCISLSVVLKLGPRCNKGYAVRMLRYVASNHTWPLKLAKCLNLLAILFQTCLFWLSLKRLPASWSFRSSYCFYQNAVCIHQGFVVHKSRL